MIFFIDFCSQLSSGVDKKIVFKLIGLKVVWFGVVTLHMGILELKEGGINQIRIEGFEMLHRCKHVLGLLTE